MGNGRQLYLPVTYRLKEKMNGTQEEENVTDFTFCRIFTSSDTCEVFACLRIACMNV
jgi:hypothetical protein